MLDGANCADPRLLERLARQRRVPFEQFSRQIQIARAFTCFQLTELIARVPRLLTDFPAEVLMVTAFPELYYDEDVRDWNAQVAFEQALANLQRLAGQSLPLTVAVFSSATTFMPSPARRRFFEKACAAGSEVWQFNSNAEGKLGLVCSKRIVPRNFAVILRKRPLTRPATAGESAVAVHRLPKGEGYISNLGGPGVQPRYAVTLSPLGEGRNLNGSTLGWRANHSMTSNDSMNSMIQLQVIYGSDGFNVSGFDRAGTPELGAGVWPGAAAGGAGALRGDVQPRAPLHPGLHLRVSRARHGCDQRGRRA